MSLNAMLVLGGGVMWLCAAVLIAVSIHAVKTTQPWLGTITGPVRRMMWVWHVGFAIALMTVIHGLVVKGEYDGPLVGFLFGGLYLPMSLALRVMSNFSARRRATSRRL